MQVNPSSVIHLLHQATSGVLATQSLELPGYPFATALPFALDEYHRPFFLISGLAEHTKNLLADHRASLLVSEPALENVLKGGRMTLIGDAQRFDPGDALATRYLRYHPDARQYLKLGGFSFFRMQPKRIRYISGYGKMGWVDDTEWREIAILPPSAEISIFEAITPQLPQGVRLLGIDTYGFDIERAGKRERLLLADAPVKQESLAAAITRYVNSL